MADYENNDAASPSRQEGDAAAPAVENGNGTNGNDNGAGDSDANMMMDRERSPAYNRGGGDAGDDDSQRDVPPPRRDDDGGRRDYRERSPRRRPPPPPPGRDREAEVSNVLGCFGLSIRTKDIDLEDEFNRYGQVEKAVIVYDQRSERSRGFGFVTMRSVEDAARCIEKLNGIELHGRNIRVAYSLTTKPHASTPGEYMGFKTDRDRPPPRRFDDRRGGYGGDRYDDRRGGGGYGGDRYDDRRSSRYDDDRYSSRRDYGGRDRDYDDRRGGPSRYDDDRRRDDRDDRRGGASTLAAPMAGGYDDRERSPRYRSSRY